MTTAAEILAEMNAFKVGRPFRRTPEEKLELLSSVWMWMTEGGYSFRGACGHCRLPPSSVIEWMRDVPNQMFPEDKAAAGELANAIKKGHETANAAREAFMQNRLLTGTREQMTAAIFALKCSVGGPDEWREAAPIVPDVADADNADSSGTTRVVIDFGAAQQQEAENAGS
jgi:hypothetical protein